MTSVPAQPESRDHLWSIVLAGGEGERLRPLTERWLGRHVPKQYCAFVGTRSMLDHTLDRSAVICRPANTFVVTVNAHRAFLERRRPRLSDGSFVFQPTNLDTAAGILFGLAHIMHRDPEATVVVFPSDHFIYPEWRFLRTVRTTIDACRRLEDRVMLLGAEPSSLEPDYGWIQPDRDLPAVNGHRLNAVESFLEKPSRHAAQTARRSGGLWNTMVTIASAQTLWSAARQHLNGLMPLFDRVRERVGMEDEDLAVELAYRCSSPRNFSTHLLQRIPEKLAVVTLEGVLWSDWGQEGRITESLQRLGKEPAFSRRCLTEVPSTAGS